MSTALRVAAFTLILLWGGFWTFFVVASAISEPPPPGTLALLLSVTLGLFAASALLAWYRPVVGGVFCLVAAGALLGVILGYLHNPAPGTYFLLATMALPPLLAGTLLLVREKAF